MEQVISELAERIRAAAAAGTPLRLRGGGSKDFYGQRLQGEVLDTRALQGIVAYEPSELFVTARAGMPLAALEAELAAQGQALPFEPPHFEGGATVGGMVAAGLSGPARAAVGALRDYVLGVCMVNGRGETLHFGGQVMKNVAGYDVSRLMAGSLGTLGLIAEVSIKVLPRPGAQATLGFDVDQRAALRALNAWAAQPLPVNASLWTVEQGRGRLLVRLRGAQAAVQAACAGMGGERMPDNVADPLWHGLREQTLPFFQARPGHCLWRLSVPDHAGPLTLPVGLHADAVLVEWGGALRWLHAPPDLAPSLRESAGAAGGSATLFRRSGDPVLGTLQAFPPLAPALARIHQRLKQQFDPAGILNPGRMYPEF